MKQKISKLMKLLTASIMVVVLSSCGGAEDRKVKYLEKGKIYLEEQNFEKAKIEFKNVLQIDPKFADAYFYMGQFEEKKKELGKALGNYKKAIELNPEYVEAKVKLARIYVIAGTKDFIESAKKLLAEVGKDHSNDPDVKLTLATIEYKTGEKEKAKKILEKVVRENKNLTEGISLLVSIYLFEKDESSAIKILKKGVVDNPDSVYLRVSLSKLLAKNKNFVEAERHLKEAIKIKPEKFPLQATLSSFYASTDQLDKAEAVLRKSIKQDDEDIKRYLILFEFLSTRVSLKSAEDELNLSIQNKPELYDLKFAQVGFYKKTNKRKEAKEVLKGIIQDKSYELEGVKARNQLANMLLEEGDLLGAKKYVDEVMAEYPNNNDSLLILSKLALANLDAITAINSLRTVVKNDPKNAEASLLLAQAQELNNESSLAEDVLKRAIESNPANVKVHINYARYLGSKGRTKEAVETVDRALTYFKNDFDLLEMKLKIAASEKNDSEVLSLLNLMEQTDSSKASVNLMKGKYLLSKRDAKGALEQFEKAYSKSQDKFESLQEMVKTYLAMDKPEKAIERLQLILSKSPNDPIANLILGQVFLLQKKIPEAREKFIKSSNAAKEWFPPYSNLALTYLSGEVRNYDKAIAVYKDAESKLRNKVPVQMQVATIYETQKKYSLAMKVYQDILSANPNNKLAANNYASLLLDFGNTSDVVRALELVKGFKKLKQPAFLDTLAWAYVKTGDVDKAVVILKSVVEKSPKVAVFRYHLGAALFELGDKSAAKSHLKIAVDSKQDFTGKEKAKELLDKL